MGQPLIALGSSNKIAVINKLTNKLMMYKLDGDEKTEVDVNFAVGVKKCRAANYISGKIVLFFQEKGKKEFQIVIVTEDGEVVEGSKLELEQNHFPSKSKCFVVDDGLISVYKSNVNMYN